MQKTLGTAIDFGIRQKFIASLAPELAKDCKVLIQFV